jgi:hypothetical protein
MGVAETSPYVPRRDDEGALKASRTDRPDRIEWALAGGSTHGYTSSVAPAASSVSCACVTEAGWNIADAG